jgi:hypothetical protein
MQPKLLFQETLINSGKKNIEANNLLTVTGSITNNAGLVDLF